MFLTPVGGVFFSAWWGETWASCHVCSRGAFGSGGIIECRKNCLIFHKQRNHRMHTTNNVPQSRCRAFLIYGELSEMGRWSKRRWRHAEGLHFSLFSPHKQEKPVSVCHNTHKHTPTQALKDTSTCTNADMYHPHHLHAHFPPPPSRPPHTEHTHSSPLFQHNPTLPCNPQQNTHGCIPPPTHTLMHTQSKMSPPPSPPHNQILRVRLDPIENAQ